MQVKIDPETGEQKVFLYTPSQKQKEDYESIRDIPFEDMSCKELHNIELGRISAQIAKQVIFQKIRSAESERNVRQMKQKLGKVINGVIKQVLRNEYIVEVRESEFQNVKFVLPKNKTTPSDFFRVGDPVQALFEKIQAGTREKSSFRFVLSRISSELLVQYMHSHIPEIHQGVIQIRAISRIPGVAAKVAVKSNDKRVDAVASCLGMRSVRIKALSELLGSEKIDILLWSDSLSQLVQKTCSLLNWCRELWCVKRKI